MRLEGGAIVRRHIEQLQGRLASHQLVSPLRVISLKFAGTPQAELEEVAQLLEPNEARNIEPAAVVAELSTEQEAACPVGLVQVNKVGRNVAYWTIPTVMICIA